MRNDVVGLLCVFHSRKGVTGKYSKPVTPCKKEKQFIVVVLAHHGLAFTLTGFNVVCASATG